MRAYTGTDIDTHENFMTCHLLPLAIIFYRNKTALPPAIQSQENSDFHFFHAVHAVSEAVSLFLFSPYRNKENELSLVMVIISGQSQTSN
jgi:hypothetical protein